MYSQELAIFKFQKIREISNKFLTFQNKFEIKDNCLDEHNSLISRYTFLKSTKLVVAILLTN